MGEPRSMAFFFKQWEVSKRKRWGASWKGRTWDEMPELAVISRWLDWSSTANGRSTKCSSLTFLGVVSLSMDSVVAATASGRISGRLAVGGYREEHLGAGYA